MIRKLFGFSSFWGEYKDKYLYDVLVRSLAFPLNRDALQGLTWHIYTPQKDFLEVEDIVKDLGVDIVLHDLTPHLDQLGTTYLSDSGVMMNQVWKDFIKRCLDSNARGLMLPVDTLFGGDSISNILQAGEQPDTVVFCLHARVHESILEGLDRRRNRFGPAASVSNAALVSLALENAHKSWTEAEFGHERINSFVGGIAWRRRQSGIIAAQHHLMTPYLINFIQSDYDFFNRKTAPGEWPVVFGTIDHVYPAHCVFPKGRARVLGSSDDAFMAEITARDSNVPPLQPYDKYQFDKFWRNELHNNIFKQFVVTVRGETSE